MVRTLRTAALLAVRAPLARADWTCRASPRDGIYPPRLAHTFAAFHEPFRMRPHACRMRRHCHLSAWQQTHWRAVLPEQPPVLMACSARISTSAFLVWAFCFAWTAFYLASTREPAPHRFPFPRTARTYLSRRRLAPPHLYRRFRLASNLSLLDHLSPACHAVVLTWRFDLLYATASGSVLRGISLTRPIACWRDVINKSTAFFLPRRADTAGENTLLPGKRRH